MPHYFFGESLPFLTTSRSFRPAIPTTLFIGAALTVAPPHRAPAQPAQTLPAQPSETIPAPLDSVVAPPAANDIAPGEPPLATGDVGPNNAPPAINAGPDTEAVPALPAPDEAPEPDAPAIQFPSNAAVPRPLPQIIADSVRYEGGVIIASSNAGNFVRLQSPSGVVTAREVRVDLNKRIVRADGDVTIERQTLVSRRPVNEGRRLNRKRRRVETVVETLRGQNFIYDLNTQQGRLDNAVLQLASFDFSTSALVINGQKYEARDVILRPGGLSPAELKIYGTPPLSLRANRAVVDASLPGVPPTLRVSGAGLYFKNTRILPVPSYVFSRRVGGRRENEAFTLTPGISFSSTDRVLVTTQLAFPLNANPDKLSLIADIGASARVGFRGGIGLESNNKAGRFVLRATLNDVVTTQLTNRIELNRAPEFFYRSPLIPLVSLPGGRRAGITFGAGVGNFNEETTGGGGSIRSVRDYASVALTTRAVDVDGPYLELFARASRYPSRDTSYNNIGYEIGYQGKLLPQVRGQVSFRANNLSGRTPFRFDRVEIRHELRTTFDVQLTPRYLVPIDLRYDTDQNRLRDERFGLLRSYKNFAYGVSYQAARKSFSLDLRSGF